MGKPGAIDYYWVIFMDLAQKAELAARLLTVRSAVARDFLPLSESLPDTVLPGTGWLEREMLPTLVLLPAVGKANALLRAEKLALALELSFLAGRVHDRTAAAEPVNGRAILAGDYLYTKSALTLTDCGFDGWLGKVGRVLARRSEARRQRLDWRERAFVPEAEKFALLPKENAEGISLAAAMAAEAAGMTQKAADAYAGFGFYLGILQGISLYGYKWSAAAEEAVDAARGALLHIPCLLEAAEQMLLAKLISEEREECRWCGERERFERPQMIGSNG